MDNLPFDSLPIYSQKLLPDLPENAQEAFQSGSNVEYLNTLSIHALNPQYTSLLFASHKSVFVEISSRWLAGLKAGADIDALTVVAALARIVPYAPYLSAFVHEIFNYQRDGVLQELASPRVMALADLPSTTLHSLLLAVFRLLTFSNHQFASLVSPAQMQALLVHPQFSIRYLAIRILCVYLYASDLAMARMIKHYCAAEEIHGPWDGTEINYLFLTLWEEKRLKDLEKALRSSQVDERNFIRTFSVRRILKRQDMSATTACVGNFLLPRLNGTPSTSSDLVMTDSSRINMFNLAQAFSDERPVLIIGQPGSGKSFAINQLLRELGKTQSVVRLCLNEQTDAKSLTGIYSSHDQPGKFNWRPGVLTQAVQGGRWVLIEDLDRAPIEVMSILLPLLERQELFLPYLGKTIRTTHGFKIIATIRSSLNIKGEEVLQGLNSLGSRFWLTVRFVPLSDEEARIIINKRFPLLRAYTNTLCRVYGSLQKFKAESHRQGLRLGRKVGFGDLIRWCRRLEIILRAAGVKSENEPIPESLNDKIFLEAVQSFAGHLPDNPERSEITGVIARELHVSAERVKYCLEMRTPATMDGETTFRIGNLEVQKQIAAYGARNHGFRGQYLPFAMTNHVLRIIEKLITAVKIREPCLLIGETGTGKTTIIQQLAAILGNQLTVVNLSQQSEASDLLGGFKPQNLRAFAIPIQEEFTELFSLTFSTKRNGKFLATASKAVSKGHWARALKLWQEAIRMMASSRDTAKANIQSKVEERQSKKRRLEPKNHQQLDIRWDAFCQKVNGFQMHLGKDSRGLTFTFVEGNIVKAARRGDWVLLDEINLASPDTLEAVGSLFPDDPDEVPSLLLTELGNIERIEAHKNFRIFGAMNPATDIGKRELPSSLRSRFTEIFVDPLDRDIDNLIIIIKQYLEDYVNLDILAASDVASLYSETKQLANNSRITDSSGLKPYFSLRTLTRCLLYVVDMSPIYGFRRALFEGFSMSFLPTLDKVSAVHLGSLIGNKILKSSKNTRSVLQQPPRPPRDGKMYVQFRHYWIPQGTELVQSQPGYIITPFVERNLLNLVRAVSTRRFSVLLQGPTSSGKTSMIEYLSKISGNKFVRINNHEHTDLQEYLGSYTSDSNGKFHYQDGVLIRALREGHWIVLDELNLAPTDVLEALNRLLDDNQELLVPETQEIVRPHENFMLFATQNPPGLYGGRKVLSRAFRNRFLELHFDEIPEDELEMIICKRSQIAPSFCASIVTVFSRLSVLRQRDRLFEQKHSFVTLRELFRWALRDADDREQLAINGFLLLAERVRNSAERSSVKSIIEEIMKIKIDENQIYSPTSTLISHLDPQLESHGLVWTKSMRRLYVLITQALKRNEPVLLIGDTGCGKTKICQAVAESMNKQLYTVNAHQNLETGDLIGSLRPVRNRAHIMRQIIEDISLILKSRGVYEEHRGEDITALLAFYDTLPQNLDHGQLQEKHNRIRRNLARVNSLFEWSDGNLVHAMRSGQHFLLDEISLADDSVLERINSLLEPDRVLLLAEKGTSDNLVSASSGFQFLATMNPGGDYGKRELSPALRNRFTEIWVPNVTDTSELIDILRANVPPSFSQYCEYMVAFATWFSETYRPLTPNVSVRDLLTWARFLNVNDSLDCWFVLYHGAAMVFTDSIGANPAAKIPIVEKEIDTQRRVCLSKLGEIFQHDMFPLYIESFKFSHSKTHLNLGPWGLETFNGSITEFGYSLNAPTPLGNVMKIMRALPLQKPILLEGSPGVGKTTLILALSKATGMPLTRINLSDQTDLMDLFGTDVPIEGADVGHFAWRDAPFLRAMQKGEWVLLDEMNLASQAVLEGLNACFDHRGQVFIPELNSTFTKHPKFTVFATQNPHHQGGGRKGLPASFVDRFTVVYADLLKEEDLSIICKQIYPDCAAPLIDSLACCITNTSHLVQNTLSNPARGGPWEINLRDLLRWLQLINSSDQRIRAGSVADFQAVLFLHRLRSPADREAVSQVLHKNISQRSNKSLPFYHRSLLYTQVSLAFLQKNGFLQTIFDQPLNIKFIDLEIAESISLSLNKRWPCLIVGASGCGKTRLVTSLAALSGASILTLPMSKDMDTMDLIGSYEQIDYERDCFNLVGKIQQVVHRCIVYCLVSGDEAGLELAILETQLQATAPDLHTILNSLHQINDRHKSMDLADIITELESFIRQTETEKPISFQWTDGVLIKALRQGQWLVLDNANLCTPSVLDRLNSLLEPNGVLSVNEYRTIDGNPTIITPHPDFRLFLLMDPHHGELSRSMRNRCTELYMLTPFNARLNDLREIDCECFLSRFQVFTSINWDKFSNLDSVELLSICLDHLDFSDYRLLSRWQIEAANGLITASQAMTEVLMQSFQIHLQIIQSNGYILQKMREIYQGLTKSLNLPSGFEDAQVINPLNNPVLISLASCNESKDLQSLGRLFEVVVTLQQYRAKLDHLKQIPRLNGFPDLSGPERALPIYMYGDIRVESNQPIWLLLKDFGREFQYFMDHDVACCMSSGETLINHLYEVLAYFRDMFELAQSHDLGADHFQIYLAIGRALVARITSFEGLRNIAQKLDRGLDAFNSLQLKTGLSMELLWTVFRPPSAGSVKQLEARLLIEELADWFDCWKWKSSLSIDKLGSLQQSLVDFYQSIGPLGLTTDSQSDNVQRTLNDLKGELDLFDFAAPPFFAVLFEGLRQCDALSNQEAPESICNLNLLADRSSKHIMITAACSNSWDLLSLVARCTSIRRPHVELTAVRSNLPLSTLSILNNVFKAPLGGLSSLSIEMDSLIAHFINLSDVLRSDRLYKLNLILSKIFAKVCHSHRDRIDPASLANCLRYLNHYGHGCLAMFEGDPPSLSASPTARRPHYFYHIIDNYFNPSLASLHLALKQGVEQYVTSAQAWILFFTGCLYLFLPDRPFDPALPPLITQRRHQKRIIELHSKLRALQEFERIFSGQTSSFRCQLVEQDLQDLGDEPTIPHVVRPQVSQINHLQAEFNNVLESITLKVPNLSLIPRLGQGDPTVVSECELLRKNIDQAVARLSSGFDMYRDITRPASAMLDGLDVGLAIGLLACASKEPNNAVINFICESTPFLGLKPNFFAKPMADVPNIKERQEFDPRILYLKATALAVSINRMPDTRIVKTTLDVFDYYYQQWKENLKTDRQAEISRSSMYRYRPVESEEAEIGESNFIKLFLTDEDSLNVEDFHRGSSEPRLLAGAIARCQRDIFQNSRSTLDQMLASVEDASKLLGKSLSTDLQQTRCEIPADKIMCAVLFSFDKHRNQLIDPHLSDAKPNFYADSNLVEVGRLGALLKEVWVRFSHIAKAWPEHAIIKDTLQSSLKLLELPHSEPLAQLIPKVEHLHRLMHEWQVVASKEYSALQLYDQLSTLLVDWRRLELSTWPSLFDIEDQKCNDNVNMWWFIVYESIIANPLSIVKSGQILDTYAEQLFTTLKDFLYSSPIGQYIQRLKMIDSFRSHLELFILEVPALGVIHNAVLNFSRYFSRFNIAILEFLHDGRRKLEKDMGEVVLLASWKDTNINTLRESAKRSHNTLFKIVRRYRTLLAKPADSLITPKLSEADPILKAPVDEYSNRLLSQIDLRAFEICQSKLPGWSLKPPRFKNPSSTALMMARIGKESSAIIDSATYLTDFTDDLQNNIQLLQQETLLQTSKGNRAALKHLKSRKNKLFTETAREVRRMGFRSNLSTEVLTKQATLDKILANSPAIDQMQENTGFQSSEYYFHQLLSLMPEMREYSGRHSEDLNRRDVVRSINFIESILSTLMESRNISVTFISDLSDLDQTVNLLRNLWAPEAYTIRQQNEETVIEMTNLRDTVAWLPSILKTGQVLLENYVKLGGTDCTLALTLVSDWKTKMEKLVKDYHNLPRVPKEFCTSAHESAHTIAKELLNDFRTDLQNRIEHSPNVAFIFQQIELWTVLDSHEGNERAKMAETTRLEEVDEALTKTLDSMLVAIQRLQEIKMQRKVSKEDNNWLLKTIAMANTCLKQLHPRVFRSMLEDCMYKMSQVALDGDLALTAALCATAMPIVQQYNEFAKEILHQYIQLHQALCKFAYFTTSSFCQVASQGFCTPPSSTKPEAGKSDILEGGMGLGEGRGEEDISKDVQDDENLSELAQEVNDNGSQGEIEDQEDAVRMDKDDLAGQIGDASSSEEGHRSEATDEDDETTEEGGKVDDLDPSAVDEKLWDRSKEGREKEKNDMDHRGKTRESDQMTEERVEDQKIDNHSSTDEESEINDVAQGEEEISHVGLEDLDPYLQEEQRLDLPEDMDISDDDGSFENEKFEDDGEASETNEIDSKEQSPEITNSDSKEDVFSEISTQSDQECSSSEKHPDHSDQVDHQAETGAADLDYEDQGFLLDNEAANTGNEYNSHVDASSSVEGQKETFEEEKAAENRAQTKMGQASLSSNPSEAKGMNQKGHVGQARQALEKTDKEDSETHQSIGEQLFKKLGDALKEWRRTQEKIQDAQKSSELETLPADIVNVSDQDFEHLPNDETKADTQALGTATQDEIQAIDAREIDLQAQEQLRDLTLKEADISDKQDMSFEDFTFRTSDRNDQSEETRSGSRIIANPVEQHFLNSDSTNSAEHPFEDVNSPDRNPSTAHFQTHPRAYSTALTLWTHYSTLTHSLSLILTEELRLILAPTLATQMRGDFRTGKRLNIKRIIPYIASNYKRDKIWMRRSVPRKRAYQIMLAVDDSKSMSATEGGGGNLAFETLALVVQSLGILEVGEICVIGFGEKVCVAHGFEKPLTANTGVEIFEHFTFQQTRTDVKRLLQESLGLFEQARSTSANSGASNLWQLQLIISDGVCEDHDGIRLLVRKAMVARIMIVFIIVDAAASSKGESVLDMRQAVFEPENPAEKLLTSGLDAIESKTSTSPLGPPKLKINRYLDSFPFPYYLVVSDVKELPSVLAAALRQWFAEVAESE